MAFQRYAVVQDGQVTAVISWAGGDAPEGLPDGIALLPEADAVALDLPRATPVDKPTSMAQTAIRTNRANIAQDRALMEAALAVIGGTGTLTTAQLTAVVRQLAQAVFVLARNDSQSNRQRNALILADLATFDASGANTVTGAVTAVPGVSSAITPPVLPGSSSARAAVPGDAVADAPSVFFSSP